MKRTATEDIVDQDQGGSPKKKKSAVREIVEAILIALILTIGLRFFIVDIFYIPSESMVPTLVINDRIVVTRFSYWFAEPERGDVIVFKYPLDQKQAFVKRLIGVPGDEIAFRENKLYVNGVQTPEPYLPLGVFTRDYGPVLIPKGTYFMCGDNRGHSSDSRVWGIVEKDLIIGKGQFIYWPFDRLGGL